MHIIIVDVNVLVEEAQSLIISSKIEESRKLINLLSESNIQIGLTPTMLKDLRYLVCARTKKLIRDEKGKLEAVDAIFAQQVALSKLDWYLENATIISVGLVDCRMARTLMKVHNDYEDNLITAAAIRTEATGIITRDEKFAKTCQVKCFSPAQAIKSIEAGLWK